MMCMKMLEELREVSDDLNYFKTMGFLYEGRIRTLPFWGGALETLEIFCSEQPAQLNI